MAEDQLSQEVQGLKSDISRLRSDLSDIAQTMKGLGAQTAGEAKGRMTDSLQQAREQLRRRMDQARSYGAQRATDVEEQIEAHPFTSVLAAFGVGFVVAKLINHGERH